MSKRRAPGYTIVETLIFLAISGVMLAAALLLFQGQQAKVQFDQSMRDLNSKITQYSQDVNSGFFPGSDKYNCAVSGTRPALSNPGVGGPAGLGANTDCIFLGKAIAVTPNSPNIQIYTVLGDRVVPNGQPNAGDPVTSFSSAFPTPASQPPQNCTPACDVTETYQMLGGATVKSSTIIDTSNTQHTSNLVGLYIDLQNSVSGSAKYLLAKGYGLSNPPDNNSVTNFVEEGDTVTYPNYPLQEWDLCLNSNSSSKTALLKVFPSALSVSTKLIMGGTPC